MEEKKLDTIIVDVFGGDYPAEVVKGAIQAVKDFENLKIILTGDELFIETELKNYEFDKTRVEIIPCSEVITCNDVPTMAIKQKKDSSLVVGLDKLRTNDDIMAMISTGSTGAVLTGGFLKIGRIKGLSRPALSPLLPTVKGDKKVLLIDCGANVDCKPINLCHFALMGKVYMESLGVKNPSIALLNIGTEDEKGNELCKKTFPLLKSLPINFVGNAEARELLSGKFDVVVTDGFSGNVLLKGSEGAILAMYSFLKQEIKAKKSSMFGALFMKKSFRNLKNKIDFQKYGGSPFLGCKKILLKAHGASKSDCIYNCILQAFELNKNSINEKIEKILQENEIKVED